MSATVIDLKDFAVRTPEQVFRVFFKLYDAAKVKTELWQYYIASATIADNEEADEEQTKVALLFDQIIALTEALENLKEGNTKAISCVVCGSQRETSIGEEPKGQA